jgi:DNA-binding transcriptional MerR regulator
MAERQGDYRAVGHEGLQVTKQPARSAEMHQIGAVAEAVGLSLATIRHYDETGLVPPSGRSAGGFRLYTDADIELLRLVKQMKPLDFSLEEMGELLDIRRRLTSPSTSTAQQRRLSARLAEYSAAADARCERLGEQLQNAQALAESLRNHWSSDGSPTGTPRG